MFGSKEELDDLINHGLFASLSQVKALAFIITFYVIYFSLLNVFSEPESLVFG